MNYYENPKRLFKGLVTNAAVKIYTAPALATGGSNLRPPSTILTEVVIANTDSSPRTLTAYLVTSGGSVADSNTIIPGSEVGANTFIRFTFASVLPAGEELWVKADTTNKICLTVSGVERTPITP